MTSQDNFAVRFAKHKDELEWLFMELYHNREGLEVLEREMAEAYNARSAELKALDKARSADPEWYKRGNMFGMTMYTDLFAGNLKELAKKLPYLKEQKLTYLHLMPLLQMPHPHNDGGYAVEDFDTVDPALGTNKDLENLTRELRKELEKIFVQDEEFNSMYVTILSFGFKYGIPADSDIVMDVRFLPNPYYVEELRPKTGNDVEIQQYVMKYDEAKIFLNKLEDMVTFLIPHYISEGKNQLVISIGCTGGKHRSVTLANELYKRLSQKKNREYGLKIEHRDIGKDALRGK